MRNAYGACIGSGLYMVRRLCKERQLPGGLGKTPDGLVHDTGSAGYCRLPLQGQRTVFPSNHSDMGFLQLHRAGAAVRPTAWFFEVLPTGASN
ncbi:hypothetical protein D3C85_1579460 [compost metagenome]